MGSEASSGEKELVAILRGVTTGRVVAIGDVLYEAGIRCIEVPLNSPDPFASIAALANRRLPDLKVGAGTVLNVEDVHRTRDAGGRLVVSPNIRVEVIRCALELGLDVMPGFATATEAFEAIDAGARRLKLFPAASYGTRYLESLRGVFPADVQVYPVGGVGARDVAPWLAAGAAGFGFGSELFRPEYDLSEIKQRAAALMRALQEARS
ncbi:MAG: 2-dehydro-3-deoxy-6-phosphogalactonate aldolase [Pseudomonadota bacterium]|nr:2-dehydro-3-deoxy-6-phosphogalactonate aldolase [Pseudomonadota bacterium]